MALIVCIIAFGFLFALMFLINPKSLPSHLQAARKGLRAFVGLGLIAFLAIWGYHKFTRNTKISEKDFIGTWEHVKNDNSEKKYEFLADGTFYDSESHKYIDGIIYFLKGKWVYNENSKRLILHYTEHIWENNKTTLNCQHINEYIWL